MAPAAQRAKNGDECFGGLAEQHDAEFEPYRAGISAEAVAAAYRLLAPSAKVGPPARSPMCMYALHHCAYRTHSTYCSYSTYYTSHLLHLIILLFEGGCT